MTTQHYSSETGDTITYSDNPIRRYSETHPERIVWDAEHGWHTGEDD